MNTSAVKYWLILAGLLAAFYGSFVAWRHAHSETRSAALSPRGTDRGAGQATAEPQPARTALTDFVLTDETGKAFDSTSLHGKIWVGSFFFTNCPGACWRLNQALSALQQSSPSSQIRYLSITCDPDNDTPEALAKYAKNFQADPARWTFLTGDFDLIRRIGNDFFQVGVDKGTHSDRAFVVDRQGTVRGRFRLTEPDQVEMLKKLLTKVEAEAADDAPESAKTAKNPSPS
jgi:cytochrome oxidase Cu insertion factor (SCO1/SenC/PrrC family)